MGLKLMTLEIKSYMLHQLSQSSIPEMTHFLFVFLLISFSHMQEEVIISKSKYLCLGSLILDANCFYKQ